MENRFRISEKRMDFHKDSLDKNSMLRGGQFLIGKMKKSYPDLQTLIDISDNYHISMDKLLKETPKMIEGFDRAAIEAKKRKRTIIILLLILIMLPVLLISVFFIRLAYAFQATPFDKRNVTQVDARMYVNLPDQTPSDAIVYTYDKEEYDTFSKQKKERIYDKVSGKIEGDIPPLRMDKGETSVRFVLQDSSGHNLTPEILPIIRVYEYKGKAENGSPILKSHEAVLPVDEEGYYYDFTGFSAEDSSEYTSVYIEIEYNCEEETDQKVASVTALNLIEN